MVILKPTLGNQVKHLLIILSILLLCSPLFGQETGEHTLYLWRTSSGDVWKRFGDKDFHSQYKGEVVNGIPNGVGTMRYVVGQYIQKYIGEWKDGESHGRGTYFWASGDKYEGEWKRGLRDGQGTMTFKNGDTYMGGWKDGFYEGQGTWFFSNGRKIVGETRYSIKWNTITYDKDGNIIEKIVAGKQQ